MGRGQWNSLLNNDVDLKTSSCCFQCELKVSSLDIFKAYFLEDWKWIFPISPPPQQPPCLTCRLMQSKQTSKTCQKILKLRINFFNDIYWSLPKKKELHSHLKTKSPSFPELNLKIFKFPKMHPNSTLRNWKVQFLKMREEVSFGHSIFSYLNVNVVFTRESWTKFGFKNNKWFSMESESLNGKIWDFKLNLNQIS